MFRKEVTDKLKYYVYRLIDPRNGETFYVGKGITNRVFDHAKGELGAKDDVLTDKLRRIRKIIVDGFEVIHVIHRHGMDERQAYEVEAALIDAYPEVTNQIGGRASDDRGLMHAKQIEERYGAKEADFAHKALLLTINRSVTEAESIYAAVRYQWKVDLNRAEKAAVVLAVRQGRIVGAFVAEKWLPATTENFPDRDDQLPGRYGFEGREASDDIANLYLQRRVPEQMRKRGAANPIRYVKI